VIGRALAVCAVVAAARAEAAPKADLVIVWTAEPAPAITAGVADAARRADAAVIDVSPAAVTAPNARPLVTSGIYAYGALEFDAALTALDDAAEEVDRTGGAGLDRVALADLFLYRALVHVQRGDDARSWDDFVSAATVDPTRVLDPARFPPRAVEQHGRAITAVAARERSTLTLSPAGCQVELDGAAVAGETIDLAFGRHWLRATCAGHQPAGRRIDVDRAQLAIDVAGPVLAPPSDDELAIQGRTAGARALVVVAIQNGIAVVRRLAPDGHELERQSITLGTSADAGHVADAVTRMLVPPVRTQRWYKSKWVWAAAGAAVATAILLPFALRGGTPSVKLELDNVPPW
jgi:hypothetical protein